MRFEWDPAKAEANLRKHRVSFDYAIRVFADPDRLLDAVADEDYGEDRWAVLGRPDPSKTDVYLVIYTDRHPDIRRIISARKVRFEDAADYHSRFPEH